MTPPASEVLARAVQKAVDDAVRGVERDLPVGIVVDPNPLVIEIPDTGQVLHDDQLITTQDYDLYDRLTGVEEGDTVLLRRKRSSGDILYFVENVVADVDPAGGSGSATPTGPAGGVLGGTYPDPSFAVDMATQAELDAYEAAHSADPRPPDGPAGGDLGGTYPAPTVVTLNGRAVTAVVFTDDARLTNSRTPSGPAGGVLNGTYPNPGFAVDMATQAELDAYEGAHSTVPRPPNGAAGGDLAGAFPNPQVSKVTGVDAAAVAAGARGMPINGRSALLDLAPNNLQLRSNFSPATNRLVDTTLPSWAIAPDDTGDRFAVYRAPATAGAPNYTLLFYVNSAGAVRFAINQWAMSFPDSIQRFYFGNNSHSYWKTADGHIWRNGADSQIAYLDSGGSLLVAGQLLSNSSVAAKFGAGIAYAVQQELLQVWDATNGQDWSLYRPANTRDLRFYSQTAGDTLTIGQNGRVSAPNFQTPTNGIERRPAWSGPRKKRWIANALADVSHRRFSLFWASRDNGNWAISEGFYVTVRTGYYNGGSRTRCFIYGGYNQPWTLVPLESAGPSPLMPQIATSLVSGNIYQAEVYLSLPQYYGVTVEIEYSEDFTEQTWGATFTAGNQLQINPDGRTTTLGSDPGLYQDPLWHNVGAAGEVGFQNSWSNYGLGFTGARFCKDRLGWVHIEGFVHNGSAAATIFALPAGFRPGGTLRFPQAGGSAFGQIDVHSDGTVTHLSGTTTDFSINCNFRAEN